MASMQDIIVDLAYSKPNHMIIWLDIHIGQRNEYIHLKKAFGSTTDPLAQISTSPADIDYSDLLLKTASTVVYFEDVTFSLLAFTNVDECLQAFEKYREKHIFFITSDTMAHRIVPIIIRRYPLCIPIYIFCYSIGWNLDWAMEYCEYIQVFNFDSELLERVTRDIAEHYIKQGRQYCQINDLRNALKCFGWAKTLWGRYDTMRQNISTDDIRPVGESKRIQEINELIRDTEMILSGEVFDNSSANSDGGHPSKSCDTF